MSLTGLLWDGVWKSKQREENAERLRTFLAGSINLLSFEETDAEIAGELRVQLEKSGTPVGPYDLLIAAQALRTGVVVVTANIREFESVPGLKWQDWSK
jgi:tRNA(fMet)-specific endonuclease VapC